VDSVIPRLLDCDDSLSLTSEKGSLFKTILSKNKLYSSRQFSISVQKFVWCGRSLGFNSCSSWNLYGRKDNLIRSSTLHIVMWEISPTSLLDRRTSTKHSRLWRLHSMATQITQSDTRGLLILGIREIQCVHTTHASGPSRASWQDC
jgi:hypothetical protein